MIALGDLNDVEDAATTQLMYGPEGSNLRGPEDITNPNSAFQRPDASDAQRLFNVTMLAPAELRWSRINGGQKDLIDHVLASAGLMPVAGKLRRVPMIDIRNFDSPTAPKTPRVEGTAPDHAPVTAVFAV